jgi:hypothetical protein
MPSLPHSTSLERTMATQTKKLVHPAPQTSPKSVAYTAFAIRKSTEKPHEYTLIQLDMDNEDNVVNRTESKPMQFFMAVYEQKQRAATLWTSL